MKIKHAALTLLTLLASSATFAACPYCVTETDTSFRVLLTRWASLDGKQLAWEADGDASIYDPGAFNFAAKLPAATSFEDALSRLDNVLDPTTERSLTAGRAHPQPLLLACIYVDTIVIRTTDQAECGEPL